jgi:hypothetical protein
MEINRAKLGEIGHPTRRSILFHGACLPQAGEAECISIVFPPYFSVLFHGAKRSLFPFYFNRISLSYFIFLQLPLPHSNTLSILEY